MSNTLSGLAVINYVSQADHRKLVDLLTAAGCQIIELSGKDVRDKESFLKAVTHQLLQEGLVAHNWASFDDLFRTMVWSINKPCVALVWTDAHQMLEGSLSDLTTAVDTFTNLSHEIYKKTDNTFVAFLEGNGPNFPPLNLQLSAPQGDAGRS